MLRSPTVIDALRPRLTPTTRFRVRSDGTAGAWDPKTGNALEVATDEAPLLALIDGKRTLSDIAEEHAKAHGFVPFAALRDLLRALAKHGLLDNDEKELVSAGFTGTRSRMERLADVLVFDIKVPAGTAIALAGTAVLLGLAAFGFMQQTAAITGWDTLLFFAGIAAALTGRGFVRAAVVGLAKVQPEGLRFSLSFGLPHLEPDGHGIVLLDRGARAVGHLAALVGSLLVALATSSHPGLAAGALAVLGADLIPFEPTSMGSMLGSLFGTADLRYHARAYLQKRILTRVVSSHFFPGEGALVAVLLLSLGWFAGVIQVLFNWGLIAVLSLLSAAVAADGMGEKIVALAGAGLLTLAMPASLIGLAVALARAVMSLRPPREVAAGQTVSSQLQSADLQAIPIFSHLDAPHLAAVAQAVKEIRYTSGARIVAQGEAGDRFFALRAGAVAVEHELPSGLVREVARLGAGDCFGETALLDRVPRTASVRALNDVTCAVLSSRDFDEVRKTLGDVDVTRLLRAAAALHKSPFFGKLPSERLSALALRLQPRNLTAGETVVKLGDAGRDFFLVGAGTLEVIDANGAKIGELRPGDHFGEVALLRDVPRTATVRAAQDALVLALPKDAFVRAMAADLTLSSRIEELAAERSEQQP